MTFSIFKEADGLVSMRRVLAFIFALVSVVAGLIALLSGAVWQVVLVCFGTPLLGTIILLFFTSWSDVAGVISAVKG